MELPAYLRVGTLPSEGALMLGLPQFAAAAPEITKNGDIAIQAQTHLTWETTHPQSSCKGLRGLVINGQFSEGSGGDTQSLTALHCPHRLKSENAFAPFGELKLDSSVHKTYLFPLY